ACAEARKLLAGELAKEPDHHWLLTQIGVTLYEQRRYAEALRRFVAALEIVADCPLTLWNLAGTLDAMGKPAAAIPIYSWLLESDRSPADDPCWESREWTDALKTDCVYRLGVCLQHLGKKDAAAHGFRQYVNLLALGMTGSYPAADALRQIHNLHPRRAPGAVEGELRQVIRSALKGSGILPARGRRGKPPRVDVEALLVS